MDIAAAMPCHRAPERERERLLRGERERASQPATTATNSMSGRNSISFRRRSTNEGRKEGRKEGREEIKKGVMVMVIIIQPMRSIKKQVKKGRRKKKKKMTKKKRESGNLSRLTYIHSGTHATHRQRNATRENDDGAEKT